MISDPELPEIIFAAVDRRLRGVHTALPAKVVSYDVATQTAKVEISVKLEIRPGEYEQPPPLEEVPVLWPRGGGYYVHLPLAAGDCVLLVFSEQDPSEWYTQEEVTEPPLTKRHGLYPFAIPGAAPLSKAIASPPEGATLGKEGGASVTVTGSNVALGSPTAADFVALATKVDANFNALKSHFHEGVTAGAGVTGASTALSSLVATGSTTVKCE